MRSFRFNLPALFAFALAACVAVPTPLPTETPTAMPEPSPTIVWFPPTKTPTSMPTFVPSPSPDRKPGLGGVLLEDDFSDDTAWSLAAANGSSVTIGDNRLTLVLSTPRSFLLTTRQAPVFYDFYAEITARTSLCTGEDEYGLMIRAQPGSSYYRFALSCDGRARVDRISGGAASNMIPWTTFGVVPGRAPGTARLGVWAAGETLNFFVDDFYLFSVRDTVLYSGTLGVFARTAGETPVTVSFSELVVREVNQ
jgi:hypothetical protein